MLQSSCIGTYFLLEFVNLYRSLASPMPPPDFCREHLTARSLHVSTQISQMNQERSGKTKDSMEVLLMSVY